LIHVLNGTSTGRWWLHWKARKDGYSWIRGEYKPSSFWGGGGGKKKVLKKEKFLVGDLGGGGAKNLSPKPKGFFWK